MWRDAAAPAIADRREGILGERVARAGRRRIEAQARNAVRPGRRPAEPGTLAREEGEHYVSRRLSIAEPVRPDQRLALARFQRQVQVRDDEHVIAQPGIGNVLERDKVRTRLQLAAALDQVDRRYYTLV